MGVVRRRTGARGQGGGKKGNAGGTALKWTSGRGTQQKGSGGKGPGEGKSKEVQMVPRESHARTDRAH